MKRLAVALAFVACSSPAGQESLPVKVVPAKASSPEPVKQATVEVKQEPPPVVPETRPEKQEKFKDQAAMLATMPADVEGLGEPTLSGYLERAQGVPGVALAAKIQGTVDGFVVELDPPVDAAKLARQFGWEEPYAVSGDVHQETFAVQLFVAEVEESRGQNIATISPRFGSYRVEARLVARPAGKLPKVSSGASPAYKLDKYRGAVKWLYFTRAG